MPKVAQFNLSIAGPNRLATGEERWVIHLAEVGGSTTLCHRGLGGRDWIPNDGTPHAMCEKCLAGSDSYL